MSDPALQPLDDRRALERSRWGDELQPPWALFERVEDYGIFGSWFLDLGATLMRELPDRLRELVALRASVRRGCWYVWAGHVLIAIHLGMSATDIARTAIGPAAFTGVDAAILRAADAALDREPVDPATAGMLSEHELLSIAIAAAFYDQVATVMDGAKPEPGIAVIEGLETPAGAAAHAGSGA